jgi:hypothetical protein
MSAQLCWDADGDYRCSFEFRLGMGMASLGDTFA